MSLWAFSAVPALNDALERIQYAGNHDRVGQPSNLAMQALQEERAAAIAALTAPTAANTQKFQAQIGKTDRAVAVFRKSAFSPEATRNRTEEAMQRTRNVGNQFDQLASIRSQITARNVSALETINTYSEAFDNVVRLLSALVNIDDIGVYQQTSGILYMYWSRDFMLREDLLLTSLRGNRLGSGGRAAFAQWAGSRAELFDLGQTLISGKVARTMSGLVNSPAFANYIALENGVVRQGRAPDPQRWQAAVKGAGQVWLGTTYKAGEMIQHDELEPAAQRIMLRVYLAGGVGLLAVIVSIALTLLFARRHARELRRLQRSAQELANERLPRVVARLRRGEHVDLEAETPRPPAGRTREVALVSEAFDTVQRTAVSTAIGEAGLRASINRVFVNLSWRSQSLLHRQLRLLDQMERRASSPEELDDLFRLDHLTTRMRRHAEGLVILSGSPTVRAWDHPVAAEDVIRAAIAEVEDYTRVELTGESSAAVSGGVVADVIHLLAELIENATMFSPPATEVTVKVETVANGLAVEVVDRGLGLSAEERDELNRRLASAVEFDLVDTERLGLFVVARLAARHDIRVSLQPSPYGGTTAIVLVPHALVVLSDDWHSSRGLGAGAPQPVGAAAAIGSPPPLGRPSRPALPAADLPPSPSGEPAPGPVLDPSGPVPGPPGLASDPAHPSFDPVEPGDALARGRGRPSREDPEAGGIEDSEITGRLPRRVRRAHLAPQLRARPARRNAEPPPGADDDFDEPSPEFSRDLMASLQSGWLRGRNADDEPGDLDPRDEWGDS
ncbi:nitrate- and nitrite sensing domain-containing protein [Spirillospora sp. NPDC048819]|uniref:sensor histidine kinase n=1 Tax=Spirillospora sp. NPDC048819 TaxID=3155268 RepID=UPI0034096467